MADMQAEFERRRAARQSAEDNMDSTIRAKLVARAQEETDTHQAKFDKMLKGIRENAPELVVADLSWATVTFDRVNMSKGVGSAGTARLAESLLGNCHVTSIDLAGNAVGDRGAQRLARVLTRPGNQIASLDLSGNGLTAVAAYWLSVAIQRAPCLTSLNLCYNSLGDEGVEHLLGAVDATAGKITELGLNGNAISKQNPSLCRLKAILKLNACSEHPHLSPAQRIDAADFWQSSFSERPQMAATLPAPPAFVTNIFNIESKK